MPTNQTISQYAETVTPNMTAEYLSQFGGVTTKTTLNNMQRSPIKTIAFVDSTYALLVTDGIILVDATAGNVIITLPVVAVALAGREWKVKKIDVSANTVTVDADTVASTLIEGATTSVLTTQYQSIKFTTEGTAAYYLIP